MQEWTKLFAGIIVGACIATGFATIAAETDIFYDAPSGGNGGGISSGGSSTDNAIVRWDGTGGDTVQDSGWTITDAGDLVSAIADGPTLIGDGAPSTVMLILRSNDTDTGIGVGASFNQMTLNAGGTVAFLNSTGIYGGVGTTGGGLIAETVSATNPVVVPYGADNDNGLGYATADTWTLVTGGAEGVRLAEASSAVNVSISSGGFNPKGVTADPCGGAGYSTGSVFYNSTSNYWCGCDGTNDVKLEDTTAACF